MISKITLYIPEFPEWLIDNGARMKGGVKMDNETDFSGYVTKYNVVCRDGRTIAPEAFKDCDGKVVPLRNSNYLDGNDIGSIILQHRSDGVYGYGRFNNSPLAKTYKRLVKDHAMNNLGIFANCLEETNRIVTFGIIRSVSICYHGANPEAYIDSVTGQEKEIDGEVE